MDDGLAVLKAFNLKDLRCKEFQSYLCKYIEKYWIHELYPPEVWNCFDRNEDTTNNNQEGFSCKVNKEVKQIHPTLGQLITYIKKQIKLSEIDFLRADSGLSRHKQGRVYKMMYERRKKMKRNYKAANIRQYLLLMGSSLISSHYGSGRTDDPLQSSSSNDVPIYDQNNASTWREVKEDLDGNYTDSQQAQNRSYW